MSNTIIFACHKYAANVHIIKPIVPFLQKNGYDIVFIHINNITGKYQIDPNLNFRHFDLSLSDPKSILKILVEEKPCLLICLEFTSLFIILLIRLAKHENIKTLYFEHGIFIKGHGDKFFLVKNFSASFYRYLVLSKIYLKFGIVLKLSPRGELKTIYNTFIKRDYSNLFDSGLFYAPGGYDIMKDRISLPVSKTYFAGYPITSSNREMEMLKDHYDVNARTVLFIHQPFVHDKLGTMSYDEEMEMLYEIDRVCNQKSLNLVIKLHPRADINFYQNLDTKKKLHFTCESISKLLVKTKIILGQFSTALFNGIILNIPIIIVPYKGINSFYYEEFIGFSNFLEDIKDLGALFDCIINNAQESKNRDLVKRLCGEINTFENQADKIQEIIKSFGNKK